MESAFGEWIGVSATIFGTGFAVWAFHVRRGTSALMGMKDTMEKLMTLRLSNIEDKLGDAVACLGEIQKDLHKIEVDHEKRISVVESMTRNNGGNP